jgi:hypothetical protein
MSRISMFVVTQIFTWVALGQAGIVQILEPNDTYRAATTKIEISALEFNSQHEFITDGTLRVTFSFPMLKRGPVPTGWTTQAQLVYFGVKGGVPLTDVVGGTSALQEDRLQRFPDRFWHHFDGPGTRELLGISDAGEVLPAVCARGPAVCAWRICQPAPFGAQSQRAYLWHLPWFRNSDRHDDVGGRIHGAP